MAYTKPEHSKNLLKKSGRSISKGENFSLDCRNVIENFRSSHAYPLTSIRTSIETKLRSLNLTDDFTVVQRLKRMPTILDKLKNREDSMCISRMEDIGGIRIIVESLDDVQNVTQLISQHRYCSIRRVRNYIERPKETGYRGCHVIYKYRSRNKGGIPYNGMFVEVQVRTVRQNAWATAVELVGAFRRESLKSNIGNTEFLEFFRLFGQALYYLESNTLDSKEVLTSFESVVNLSRDIKIISKLNAYRSFLQHVQKGKGAGFYVLVADYKKQSLKYWMFEEKSSKRAQKLYHQFELEHALPEEDVVLIYAHSLDQLRQSYPQYFGDTNEIIELIGVIHAEWKAMKKRMKPKGLFRR